MVGQHRGIAQTKELSWRVKLSAGILLAIIVVSFVSLWTPWLRVCTAPNTCRPLQLQDPPVVLSGLLVALLIFPDPKRVKLGGFEVEQHEKAQPSELLLGTRAKVDSYNETIEGTEDRRGTSE